VIAAADFFTAEVWTARGLVTHYVLFVVHHATRAVHIAGITTNPNGAFMAQIARNLTDPIDGFLLGKRYLILDGDTKFTDQFKRILHDAGVEIVHIAYQAPNMNAIAERWVLSVKSECLDRMILFDESSLRRVLQEYGAYFHQERPHQGLGNEISSRPRRLPAPSPATSLRPNDSVGCCAATVAPLRRSSRVDHYSRKTANWRPGSLRTPLLRPTRAR